MEIPEGLRYLGVKILTCLEVLYNFGYDVVYKTTLSSIVIPQNFQSAISSIRAEEMFYGGTLIKSGCHPFASGANLMINRKTMEFLLSHKSKWNHGLLDDVAIGRLLENIVPIAPLETLNVSSTSQVDELQSKELSKVMHIRCKSDLPKRNDVEIKIFLRKIESRSLEVRASKEE
jgi:hypothetical protein